MGVPSFYRWLCKKYPRVPVDAVGDEVLHINHKPIPINTSLPNPNGVEYDNLYLDMNGIIHPCCHPETGELPPSEEEMMVRIFAYIDRIFSIVRPRKLLYMAIDGVAPRAKMNQQRQRRFRAAQERNEHSMLEAGIRSQFENEGNGHMLPAKSDPAWDSNVITPGTPFMAKLTEALHFYIAEHLNTDPGWANIKVILSDARVPGEGEHKILHFIRNQRALPGYNPQTRHCLYGMDADLIMLALSSHEPNFSIIREVVLEKKDMICRLCNKPGHIASGCAAAKEKELEKELDLNNRIMEEFKDVEKVGDDLVEYVKPEGLVPYQFLRINVLREYLATELFVPHFPLWDIDRCIDDWIFLCFFVGNDFLPHMPALEIREGAIDVLVNVYKQILPAIGDYLTQDGEVNLVGVDILLSKLGEMEKAILKKRFTINHDRQKSQAKKQRLEGQKAQMQAKADKITVATADAKRQRDLEMAIEGKKHEIGNNNVDFNKRSKLSETTDTVLVKLGDVSTEANTTDDVSKASNSTDVNANADVDSDGDELPGDHPATTNSTTEASNTATESLPPKKTKKKKKDSELTSEDTFKAMLNKAKALMEVNEGMTTADEVKLGSQGYESRYYKLKVGLDKNNESDAQCLKIMMQSYIEGLLWVFEYYFQGVCSWDWYYPYHYAPLVSDLINVDDMEDDIRKSINRHSFPFKPFQQLLSVFPAASSHALPKGLANLMHDPNSLISDFYPTQFGLDLNGKKYLWQGVVLLPFIDEYRLYKESQRDDIITTFTLEEKRRNTLGCEYIFFTNCHPLADHYLSMRNKLVFQQCEHDVDIENSNFAGTNKNMDVTQYDEVFAASTLELSDVYSDVEKLRLAEQKITHVRGMENTPVTQTYQSRLNQSFTFDHVVKALSLQDRCCELALGSNASTVRQLVDWDSSDGLYGYISPMYNNLDPKTKTTISPPFKHSKIHSIERNQVYSCVFTLPTTYKHSSQLLPGCVLPSSVLEQNDLEDVKFAVPDRWANTVADLERISNGGSVYSDNRNAHGVYSDSFHLQNQRHHQNQQKAYIKGGNKNYGFQNNNNPPGGNHHQNRGNHKYTYNNPTANVLPPPSAQPYYNQVQGYHVPPPMPYGAPPNYSQHPQYPPPPQSGYLPPPPPINYNNHRQNYNHSNKYAPLQNQHLPPPPPQSNYPPPPGKSNFSFQHPNAKRR